MKILGGFEYREYKGSGQITITDGTINGSRIFIVPWEQSLSFSRMLMETQWEAINGFMVQTVSSYPWVLPDGTTLACNSVRIEGMGKCISDTTDPAYDWAMITADFGEILLGSEPETIEEESLDFSGEFINTPKGTWKYEDTGYTVDESHGVLVCTIETTLTIHGVSEVPKAGIRSCIGKLNDSSFRGAGTGRVLFVGASTKRIRTTGGRAPAEITLKFKEKQHDWNYVLGKDGSWHKLVDKATGSVSPYSYSDFAELMRTI
jgi:hypothetical protein